MSEESVLAGEIADSITPGLDADGAAEARTLAGALAVAWSQEAGSGSDRGDVLEVLRGDFRAGTADLPPSARLDRLRAEVLRRRVSDLNARTWALGVALVDGAISDADAREQGEALLREAEALAAEVGRISDAATRRPLERQVRESAMEALYAAERQTMSLRLNGYVQRKGTSPSP